MTLVVVKKVGDAIIVFADTKLTAENSQPWTVTSQANKLVCLDQNWVLAYSGNTYAVDLALKAIEREKPLRFGAVRDLLLSANRESVRNGSEAEFLLIGIMSLGIHLFSNGRVTRVEGSNAWIGSKNAFEKYQELNHLPPGATHPLLAKPTTAGSDGYDIAPQVIDEERKEVEGRIDRIFKALIEDGTLQEVGGFSISMVVYQGVARYWPRSGRILAVPAGGLPSETLRDPIFGNLAFGDFQYDVISGWDATRNFVAINFRSVKKALVFNRWEGGLPYAKLITDISEDAASDLQSRYGFPMWSVRVTKVGRNEVHINADPPRAA